MEWIVPIIMILFLSGMIYLFAMLALKASAMVAKSRIISAGIQTAESVEALMCASFGVRNVYSNVCVPNGKDAQGKPVFVTIDDIVLLKNSIAVIRVISRKGEFFTASEDGRWTVTVRDIYGNASHERIKDPIAENYAAAKALSEKLTRDGWGNIQVYNIVVFTSEKVSIDREYAEICHPTEAVEKLEGLQKSKRYVLKKSKVRRTIAKYSELSKKVRARNMLSDDR